MSSSGPCSILGGIDCAGSRDVWYGYWGYSRRAICHASTAVSRGGGDDGDVVDDDDDGAKVALRLIVSLVIVLVDVVLVVVFVVWWWWWRRGGSRRSSVGWWVLVSTRRDGFRAFPGTDRRLFGLSMTTIASSAYNTRIRKCCGIPSKRRRRCCGGSCCCGSACRMLVPVPVPILGTGCCNFTVVFVVVAIMVVVKHARLSPCFGVAHFSWFMSLVRPVLICLTILGWRELWFVIWARKLVVLYACVVGSCGYFW